LRATYLIAISIIGGKIWAEDSIQPTKQPLPHHLRLISCMRSEESNGLHSVIFTLLRTDYDVKKNRLKEIKT
jgi:hypothetical protein